MFHLQYDFFLLISRKLCSVKELEGAQSYIGGKFDKEYQNTTNLRDNKTKIDWHFDLYKIIDWCKVSPNSGYCALFFYYLLKLTARVSREILLHKYLVFHCFKKYAWKIQVEFLTANSIVYLSTRRSNFLKWTIWICMIAIRHKLRIMETQLIWGHKPN